MASKFNTIEEARSSDKARQALAIVEFIDGTFGLRKAIEIPGPL